MITSYGQKGFAVGQILAGVALLSFLLVVGYGAIRYSLSAIDSSQRSEDTLRILDVSSSFLVAESSDSDGDGFYESIPGASSVDAPVGGFIVPVSVPDRLDSWGNPIGYCPWDQGSVNSSAGRISGSLSAVMSDVGLAVLSMGRNGVYETSCADLFSGSPALGDDISVSSTLLDMLSRNPSGSFYGPAVDTKIELDELLASGHLKDGEVRVVKDSGKIWRYSSSSSVLEQIAEVSTGGIEVSVSTAVANFNLNSHLGSPVDPADYIVTIEKNVAVYSADPALPAFSTGALPAGSAVKLVNLGSIIGAGGNGGTAGNLGGDVTCVNHGLADGGKGGDAVHAYVDLVVVNENGKIYAGGGGGGAGSSMFMKSASSYYGYGGMGGGGGQGYSGGLSGEGGVGVGGYAAAYEGCPAEAGSFAAPGDGLDAWQCMGHGAYDPDQCPSCHQGGNSGAGGAFGQRGEPGGPASHGSPSCLVAAGRGGYPGESFVLHGSGLIIEGASGDIKGGVSYQ